MANKETYKKQQKDKKRYETLRTFMSSFTLTAIVVVAVAISIPKSPIAVIEDVKIFETDIVYQVLVTDEDEALDLSSLKIVLDGQLEDYTYPLSLGLNVGVFEGLRPNTGYQLQVYGNKGYGDEKLASMRVETNDNSNGAIISYELIDALDFYLNYEVDILYSDPNDLYSEVNLYYTYLYPDEESQFYDVIPITSEKQTIELFDVPNEHTKIHMYLEGVLVEGGEVILDELTFYVPFELSTYLYLDQKSNTNLHFQFYEDYYFTEGVTYQAEIYYGHMLIDETEIVSSIDVMSHDGATFNFSNLKKDTTYKVVVNATYIDPYTLREETIVLHEEEHMTLADYEIIYDINETDEAYEIYMYLNDPNHYFQVPYYIIYDLSEGFPIYYEEMMYDFIPDGDGKYVEFIINKPDLEHYQLIIGTRGQMDMTINQIIYDEIIEK